MLFCSWNMCSAYDFLPIFNFQSFLYDFILSLSSVCFFALHSLSHFGFLKFLRNFTYKNVKSFPLKCLQKCVFVIFYMYDIMSIMNDSFTLSFYERIVKPMQNKTKQNQKISISSAFVGVFYGFFCFVFSFPLFHFALLYFLYFRVFFFLFLKISAENENTTATQKKRCYRSYWQVKENTSERNTLHRENYFKRSEKEKRLNSIMIFCLDKE